MRTNFETFSSKFLLEPFFNQNVFTSLVVQLLHSHTFEPERQTPKTFIEDYHRYVDRRKQLSQSLRMFLQVRSSENTDRKLEVDVHDNLRVLRSFVEQLYASKSDRELEYPLNEMLKVYRYSTDKKTKNALEMLGGTFVMFDVLRALCQSACDHDDHNYPRIRTLLVFSYRILNKLIRDNRDSVYFLASTPSFISNTKSLFGASGQTGNDPLFGQISKFFAIFSYHLSDESRRLASFEIVEPMLRALMSTVDRLDSATLNPATSTDGPSAPAKLYQATNHLLAGIRNCFMDLPSPETCRQLERVPGGSEFLLTYLEESVEAMTEFDENDLRCSHLIIIVEQFSYQKLCNGVGRRFPAIPMLRGIVTMQNVLGSKKIPFTYTIPRAYLPEDDA